MSKIFTQDTFLKVFAEQGYSLDKWLDELRLVVSELKTLTNDIQSKFNTGCLLSAPALAIGTTKPNVSHQTFFFIISGSIYTCPANADGIQPGNDVIPMETFGAIAFDIGIDGAIHTIEATDNATGYDTALLAIDDLPEVATNHIRLGILTASDVDGNFTLGTSNLDHAGSIVTYTDNSIGLLALSGPITSLVPFAFND